MAKVPVRDENGTIVARVEYNENLDFWDGHNMTGGMPGRHLGLTRLKKSGRYVLIHGSQFEGERSWAEVITPNRAYQSIIGSGNEDLFELFPELLKTDEEMDTEEGEDDIKTTIQVTRGIKDRLESIKLNPGETYQELLVRLIPGLADEAEQHDGDAQEDK